METKALAVAPGGGISTLEGPGQKLEIEMYRQGLHVYVEKAKLDEHIDKVKQAKKLNFRLSHFGIERTGEGTFYVFSGEYYRQLGVIFKLPPWENVKARAL